MVCPHSEQISNPGLRTPKSSPLQPWTPPPSTDTHPGEPYCTRHHVPQAVSIGRMDPPEGTALVLLAGKRSGFATSDALSIPSSQMAHPPRNPRYLRKAVLRQARAPSLQIVSLPHFGFKASSSTSSHRERTAEGLPQGLRPLADLLHTPRLALR